MMNRGAIPLLVYSKNCNQVIEEISGLLTGSRFTVVESFDLQAARASHRDCACPHHGTDQCTCQLAVLLVYGIDGAPVTLTIHGNDERAELSIVETPDQKVDPIVKAKIISALEPEYSVFSNDESIGN